MMITESGVLWRAASTAVMRTLASTPMYFYNPNFCTNYTASTEVSTIFKDLLIKRIEYLFRKRTLGSSANPLLEFCLDGGGLARKCMNDTFDLENQRTTGPAAAAVTDLLQPCLLSHCSTCSEVSDTVFDQRSRFVAKLSMHLRQTGCDINVQDSRGLTPLHHLIQGNCLSLSKLKTK